MSVRQVIPFPGAPADPVSYMAGLRLSGRPALVVGGGAVATQRARALLASGAVVTVVAPRIGAELLARWAAGEIVHHARLFAPADLHGMAVVLVAIDDRVVSAAIARYARQRGTWVNVADRPELCDFYLPAIHRAGPVQVAVSADGAGPGLAARLRDEIRDALPADLPAAVENFAALRQQVRSEEPDPAIRMARLAKIARETPWSTLSAGLPPAPLPRERGRVANGREGAGDSPQAPLPRERGRVANGREGAEDHPPVLLASAGPGNPRLLTLAARDALAAADLVVADRLVPAAILALAGGRVVLADDKHDPATVPSVQSRIYTLLREAHARGERCVRLCAGDVAIFGRLHETVEALSPVPVEVIPGVSALTAPGFPLTARGVADRFTVVSARGAGGSPVSLPPHDPRQTLVIFMGAGSLPALSSALLSLCYPPGAAALVVSQATRPGESRQVATVATLGDLDAEAPAVIYVGGTAALAGEREQLGGRERQVEGG
ncbi:MAG: siroheme synthase [Deltaproteobacteria bacterium]|nr:siroheme synthase [Deltaproteobacteria bacterium]